MFHALKILWAYCLHSVYGCAILCTRGATPTFLSQMNFWTPERCKTIDTLQLMDNSCEMSMQAELTNNAARKARLLENVEMIQAELRSRA